MSQVVSSISFFVKSSGCLVEYNNILNKNMIRAKNAFTLLCLFLKNISEHEGDYKKG